VQDIWMESKQQKEQQKYQWVSEEEKEGLDMFSK
jgi:hypothetical protein